MSMQGFQVGAALAVMTGVGALLGGAGLAEADERAADAHGAAELLDGHAQHGVEVELGADAAADACFADCGTKNDSCKRVCPTTLGAPCQSACDSQAQTCRLNCRNR